MLGLQLYLLLLPAWPGVGAVSGVDVVLLHEAVHAVLLSLPSGDVGVFLGLLLLAAPDFPGVVGGLVLLPLVSPGHGLLLPVVLHQPHCLPLLAGLLAQSLLADLCVPQNLQGLLLCYYLPFLDRSHLVMPEL